MQARTCGSWRSCPPPQHEFRAAARGRARRGAVLRGRGRGRLGRGAARQRPLATEATALTLAEPAPDAELLPVHQRVLQAVRTDLAVGAHRLRLTRRRSPLREEQIGVDAQAVRLLLPALVPGLR